MPSSQNSRIANPDFADAHSAGGAVLQGRQAALDPVTADYSGVTIRSLQNAVYVRIVTPRGSYWDDPQMGSRLHLLKREKDLSNREQRAQDYIREALQPILDDSRADDRCV